MCFIFISEQTATCATYSVNWLVFITEMKSVYSAVRTGALNKAVCASSLKGWFWSILVILKSFLWVSDTCDLLQWRWACHFYFGVQHLQSTQWSSSGATATNSVSQWDMSVGARPSDIQHLYPSALGWHLCPREKSGQPSVIQRWVCQRSCSHLHSHW